MTPTSADVRGGIRNWGSALGNLIYGNCVIAGFEQLRKCHNVTKASTWKRILYRIGFRPPHDAYSIEIYTEYLAAYGQKPGPTVGVDPTGFFTWAKTKGLVRDWGLVDPKDLNAVKDAMVTHRGCLLGIDLTNEAYQSGAFPGARWVAGTVNPALSHAIALVEYNENWLACVTWGFLVYVSPAFITECSSGCWWFE